VLLRHRWETAYSEDGAATGDNALRYRLRVRPVGPKKLFLEGERPLVFFFSLFRIFAFHDTPSVFGYAVGRGLCLANSTATVLLRHRWDRRTGPSAVLPGDNALRYRPPASWALLLDMDLALKAAVSAAVM
jgi:hypothetical protein